MLKIKYHTKFKKDYKLIIKRGYNLKLLEEIIDNLANFVNGEYYSKIYAAVAI